MSRKFRKKPIVIEATQWFKNGDHPEDACEIFLASGEIDLPKGTAFKGEGHIVRYYRRPSSDGHRHCEKCSTVMHLHGWIDTLEGGHIVCPGDWIIQGIKGELYPCKPDIFEATYELVEEPA